MSKVFFDLEDDALIIANFGKGFSRKGVVSICNMDLSAKNVRDDRAPDDSEYDEDNEKLVCSILEKRIKKYDTDFNDLIEDANREESAGKSYAGRFVLELLQNVDDAANTDCAKTHLIGTKGIGFKSVLEITEEPEIYSGKFNFHFSRSKSREILKDLVEKWEESNGIPVCRLPHKIERDEKVQRFFDEGYKTVLRLPLIKEKKEFVRKKLSGFPIESLLFCQSLESVNMRVNPASRNIAVCRLEEGLKVELTENGDSQCWRVWRKTKEIDGEKRLSISICLPVEGNQIRCLEEVPELYVFFPTAERVPDVYALIHASCEVEDNRKHPASRQPHQDEICEMLDEMTGEILSEIPAHVALQAFGKAGVAAEDGAEVGMAAQLSNTIATTVQNTAFVPVIGGGKVKPGDARLWEYDLGRVVDASKVKGENLCEPTINNDDELTNILRELAAECLSDNKLAELFSLCHNKTKEDCLKVWKATQSLMEGVGQTETKECAARLRKVPFWRIRNGQGKDLVRAVGGDIPLVKNKPKDGPEWLPVDVVCKDFQKVIDDEIKQCKEENPQWQNPFSGHRLEPLLPEQRFDYILLPYCKQKSQKWWQENGWKVLDIAFKWGGRHDKYEPLVIGAGDDKEKRAKCFHLPVGKGAHEWAPALQCYVGSAWGGLKVFDKYFMDIQDRYLLSSHKDWKIDISPDEKENWERLISWLGCSWVFKIKQSQDQHPNRSFVDHTSWHAEFEFEHFDEIFSDARGRETRDHSRLLDMLPEMHKAAKEKKASYYYYHRRKIESYALQQLQKNEWVPCKNSLLYPGELLFKPDKTYLPDYGLGGFLPEVNKGGLDSSAWSEVKNILVELGSKDCISDDTDQLVEYMERLSEYAKKNKDKQPDFLWGGDGGKQKKRGKIGHAAKAIFSAYSETQNPGDLGGGVKIPCLKSKKEGEVIYFKKAEKVYWADKPYFDDPVVRREILKIRKLHVFFRFLEDGRQFGLEMLSEHLGMTPVYGNILQKESEKLRRRYEERRVGMGRAIGQELPKELKIVAYDNISVKAEAYEGINPNIRFWEKSKSEVEIAAGSNSDMYQGLAAALDKIMDRKDHKKEYKSAFEHLLKEKNWENFLDRLRNDHQLTEESILEIETTVRYEEDHTNTMESGTDQPSVGDDSDSTSASSSPGNGSTRSPSPGGRPRGTDGGATNSGNTVAGNSQGPQLSHETPKIEVVNYVWGPQRNSPGGSGGAGGSGGTYDSNGDDREPPGNGARGEDALLKWLEDQFGPDCVTNMNEKHQNNPGYDILVKKDGDKYYYECKSFGSATPPRWISMTKAQVELAERKKDRYRLCVIYDVNTTPVKMLPPIDNPCALEKVPAEYKINVADRDYDTDKKC